MRLTAITMSVLWLLVSSPAQTDTRPHMVILLDNSGSMAEWVDPRGHTRADVATDAVVKLLTALDEVERPDMVVSLYTWATTLHQPPRLPPTALSEAGGAQLARRVGRLVTIPGSNTETGKVLKNAIKRYGENCRPLLVIIVTDDPPDDTDRYELQAAQAIANGVSFAYLFTEHSQVQLAVDYFTASAGAQPGDWIIYPGTAPPDWPAFIHSAIDRAGPYACTIG